MSKANEIAKRQLTEGLAALRSSEGWKAWIQARANLYNYSWNNCMLIHVQRPNATRVRGARQWEKLFNRRLLPGARKEPIWILAPMMGKRDPAKAKAEQKSETYIYFKGVRVFDVSQTEQIPDLPEIPLSPPSEPITGDSHEHLIAPLLRYAHAQAIEVEFTEMTRGEGSFDVKKKLIRIKHDAPPNQQLRILAHELAHAAGIGYEEYGHQEAEVLADATAYLCCHAWGLDTASCSLPYIEGWGQSKTDEALSVFASKLDEVVAEIKEAAEPSHSATSEPNPQEEATAAASV